MDTIGRKQQEEKFQFRPRFDSCIGWRVGEPKFGFTFSFLFRSCSGLPVGIELVRWLFVRIKFRSMGWFDALEVDGLVVGHRVSTFVFGYVEVVGSIVIC